MVNHEIFITIAFYGAIFGIFCCISFIMFLFFTRESRKVEGFGFSLGQNCVIDILFTLSCMIAKFDFTSRKGYFIYAVTFLDFEISPVLFKTLTLFMVFMIHLILYVIGIPFLIRYLRICKKIHLGWKTIFKMYFVVLVYESIVIYFMNISLVPFPEELAEIRMRPQFLPNKNGRFWNFIAAKIVSFQNIRIILKFILGQFRIPDCYVFGNSRNYC